MSILLSSEIMIELHAQNGRLMAENKRLRKALKPFAEFGSDALDSDYERAREVFDEPTLLSD